MEPALKKGFGLGGRIDRALALCTSPSFPQGTDEYWMEQALIESMNSIGISSPNPAVGCLLVVGESVVGRGHTQAYRKEHAERMAFLNRDPAADLSRATAYVTLEPCSHHGHQPPCVELLLASPIPRIVIAVRDPDPRVNGEGIRRLRDAKKEVVLSVLEPECRAWNLPFFRNRETGRLFWAAKWAETPSGHLADASGHSKWITAEKSRAYTHWLRQKYDAIVVGARTFLEDRPRLTVRDCALPHQRHPVRWVFDPKGLLLSLPADAISGFTVFTSDSVLRSAGASGRGNFISIPEPPGSPDLVRSWIQTVESLRFDPPVQSIMVEGGAALLRSLFREGVFQAVHRFVGEKDFLTHNASQHLGWSPDQKWILQSIQEFDRDLLREWIKKD